MKILISFLLIINIFCWSSRTNPPSKMDNQNIITTYSELTALEGQSVWIKGKYTIHNPYSTNTKMNVSVSNLPIKIVLEDNEEVFLELFGDIASSRNEVEIEQFKNQPVYAKGVFYSEMPSNNNSEIMVATMGGACLHPVDSIVLVQ